MTPNPIMTRGYELDSFGMPKPTPADTDQPNEPVWIPPIGPVWSDSMMEFWGRNGR